MIVFSSFQTLNSFAHRQCTKVLTLIGGVVGYPIEPTRFKDPCVSKVNPIIERMRTSFTDWNDDIFTAKLLINVMQLHCGPPAGTEWTGRLK